jgi:hypothetical protein
MDINKYTSRIKYSSLPENFCHQDSSNFVSNYEYTKTLSSYHFDPFVVESEGDYVEFIGRYTGNWDQELADLIEKSKEMTWKDLSQSKQHPGFKTGVSVTIEQENYDSKIRGLEHNAYTQLVLHDYVMSLAPFKKMVDFWQLKNVAVRGQIQQPGQCYIMHVDKLWHRNPSDPSKIIRLIVNLSDYAAGQMVQYGNYNLMQWRAGDIHVFDTLNVPHCTANMSDRPRPILVITGIRTDETDVKLKSADKNFQISI